MGHDVVEVLCRAKVSSNVPAAPWDPTTVVTRSRAAQASPAGTEVVVPDEVDELPVDAVAPVLDVVLPPPFAEQAEIPTAPSAAARTRPGRDQGRGRVVRHRSDRCRVETVRS